MQILSTWVLLKSLSSTLSNYSCISIAILPFSRYCCLGAKRLRLSFLLITWFLIVFTSVIQNVFLFILRTYNFNKFYLLHLWKDLLITINWFLNTLKQSFSLLGMFTRAWMHRDMWFWPKNATKEIWFARLKFSFDKSSGSRTIKKKKKLWRGEVCVLHLCFQIIKIIVIRYESV